MLVIAACTLPGLSVQGAVDHRLAAGLLNEFVGRTDVVGRQWRRAARTVRPPWGSRAGRRVGDRAGAEPWYILRARAGGRWRSFSGGAIDVEPPKGEGPLDGSVGRPLTLLPLVGRGCGSLAGGADAMLSVTLPG